MAERGRPTGLRELAEQLVTAGVGAVSLTAERTDQLVDELAERSGLRREEARRLIDELLQRWRGDAVRLGERAGAALEDVFRQLGVVSRSDYDELELQLAQVEHRLRLLEESPPAIRAAAKR